MLHHIVRIGSTIYCGGGFTGHIDMGNIHIERQVFQYSPEQDTWSLLPFCPTLQFSLTKMEGKLVTVGGRKIDQPTPIEDVYIFQTESQKWEKSLPPLATARFFPTAFNYESALVVSGGYTHWDTDIYLSTRTATVEVFLRKTFRWYCAEPLPDPHSSMSSTIIGDTCYLIGGVKSGGSESRQVYCTSITNLISPNYLETGKTEQASPSPHSIWQVLPECPLHYSTAAELRGCLVTIGGRTPGSAMSSTAVYRYSPRGKSWERLSSKSLPVERAAAAATKLEWGEIIFVGGEDRPRKPTNSVFISSLEQ